MVDGIHSVYVCKNDIAMKKVLIVFDGGHTSVGALDFAKQLNEKEPILLTGLFLPSIDYTDVMLFYAGGMAGPLYIPTVDTDPQAISKNVLRFKEFCVKHGIEHRIHEQVFDKVLKVIREETRYADMVLLDGKLFYSNLGEITQREYLENTLYRAECPVLVLPENYTPPQNIVISFDGSESSVFAMKQFTYLLPQFCDLPALLVYASPDDTHIPGIGIMEELAARHFKDLTIFRLEADAKKYFNTWMMDRGNSLIITGGYHNGGLAQMFRKHFVEDVIKDHKLPVFIAHK